MMRPTKGTFRRLRPLILLGFSGLFVICGLGALWVATLQMPDLDSFQNRHLAESTKIYDRTGEILLFDTGANAKRTVVPLASISQYIQQGTIAIEDSNFYKNSGIEPLSILRAFLADVASGGFDQGASTITQQVVKNSLLTQDKTITRKIKEWVIAVKLTRVMSKDAILETYLNETSYGGTIFGVEEASRAFFGKSAQDVSMAQAAYLAAIPQAPTYYSPFGTHRESLDSRQRLVLVRMRDLGMITAAEFETATKEKVQFLSKNDASIRAPHFVMYVKDYLTQKYGEDRVANEGLRVITTLDYSMQQTGEDVVKKFSKPLAENFNASNTAVVAINPKNGDILTMIGSRDYFDPKIDGNYNVALAKRQPGSTFKPFVYATAFKEGYTPETTLFDVRTEFSTRCTVEGKPKNPSDDPEKVCYSPDEYDNIFEGPQSMRRALAHSRNIPAVKTLYLTGIASSIQTARDLGITTLTDPNRYGLTLVLGGGEVTLLDLTSAYGVFADDGQRSPYRSVLRVEDSKGVVLEQAATSTSQVLDADVAHQISDILSDNSVRMDSLRPIADSVGQQVAIKTGTTNDYSDVWTVGYTSNLVVGAWAGNNDNVPMQHNVAGLIISPLWGAFMSQVAKKFPSENFKPPPAPLTDNKPVLRGIWNGGISYKKDVVSGKLATQYTPPDAQQEVVFNNVHTILHWLNKDDPRGPAPADPTQDSQYPYWEYGVRNWLQQQYLPAHPDFKETLVPTIPTAVDDVHVAGGGPQVSILSPSQNSVVNPKSILSVQLQSVGKYQAKKTELYLNGKYVLTNETTPLNFTFVPADVGGLSATNTLSVTVYDTVLNSTKTSVNFSITQ